MFKTLFIFGTRPEAIKMAPIIQTLRFHKTIETKVCITSQHVEMLHSVLELFDIKPDFNLDVMEKNQDLTSLTSRILTKLPSVFEQYHPDLILIHGDTTTTLSAALSAYYHHIRIAHVEAGLRTHNIWLPWPEEANRQLAGHLSEYHFAPTLSAQQNLLNEGVPEEKIYITGNTVIDALFEVVQQLQENPSLRQRMNDQFSFLQNKRRVIFVTGHRRESFGDGFERICEALANVARRFPEIDIVYPVHLNPQVQYPVKTKLSGISNIYLIEPVDYVSCVFLMQQAYLILTDSGGIQEEAPSLGKPVLVMRDKTERPEAVEAGTVRLVGTDVKQIEASIANLLIDEGMYHQMSQALNPYGDGLASKRIVQIVEKISGMHHVIDSKKNVEKAV